METPKPHPKEPNAPIEHAPSLDIPQPSKKEILNEIRKEKRAEDQSASHWEKSPITHETLRAFDRISQALPDDASKQVMELWKQRAKYMTKSLDWIVNRGNTVLSAVILSKIFSLSTMVIGTPDKDMYRSQSDHDNGRMVFVNMEKDKPMLTMGIQLQRPEMIPAYIGKQILFSLRRLPVRLAADQAEAYMRTEKGRKWLADIAVKKGFRTEEIMQKIVTGVPNQDVESPEHTKTLGNRQVFYAASASPSKN